jgi:hypothetical protein
MPSLKDMWLGRDVQLQQKPTGTPEQGQFNQNIIQQLMQMMQPGGAYGQSQDWLSGLYGPNAFKNFSQPYNQQFEQQVLPGIAERFAGFGANSGALSSSGFGQALAGGASDFQSKLAQLFSQLQMQASGQIGQQFNQLANTGLNYQPFAYYERPGMQSMGMQFMNALAGAAGGGM